MPRATPHPLRPQLADVRNLPGVYRIVAADGEVLYVGKSKRLRTRLLSYLRAREGDKAFRIVQAAAGFRWEYVGSEFGALLRELRLIKQLRPRYNVQHKRSRSYLFVKLTSGAAPRLLVSSRVAERTAAYYGPFLRGPGVRQAVRELNDLLGLRDCAVSTPVRFADQRDLFPTTRTPRCHRAELGLCLGPCAALCGEAEYRERAALASRFLDGCTDEPLRRVEAKMEEAAARMHFELAATLRDRRDRLRDLREEFLCFRERIEALTFAYQTVEKDDTSDVYLIRRGRVRATLPAPTTHAQRIRLARRAAACFGSAEPSRLLVDHAHADEMLLVAGWFRSHPAELDRTLPPGRVHELPLSC